MVNAQSVACRCFNYTHGKMIHTCDDIHGQGLKYVFGGKCRNIN